MTGDEVPLASDTPAAVWDHWFDKRHWCRQRPSGRAAAGLGLAECVSHRVYARYVGGTVHDWGAWSFCMVFMHGLGAWSRFMT